MADLEFEVQVLRELNSHAALSRKRSSPEMWAAVQSGYSRSSSALLSPCDEDHLDAMGVTTTPALQKLEVIEKVKRDFYMTHLDVVPSGVQVLHILGLTFGVAVAIISTWEVYRRSYLAVA